MARADQAEEQAAEHTTEQAATAQGPERVAVTDEAAAMIRQLTEQHGPLMFHQSGGCCDGSSPMCYELGELRTGDSDVLLGRLAIDGVAEPVPFWISAEPVRVLEPHPPHRGRGAGPGQRILTGGTGGRALPDPLPAAGGHR